MALSRPDTGWQKLIERCLRELEPQWELTAPQIEPEVDAVSLARPALDSLGRYLDLLLQWNARVDLTAARNAEELVDLFVADAAILALASRDARHWVDVGTGAGSPGLPLELMRPDLTMELVEPKTKRVTFLRTVVSSLGMANTEVRRMGVDGVAADGFDVALSRATFSPEIWLAEGARLARRAVWVLLAQGDAPTLPGWQVDLSVAYRWPLSAVSRRALRFVRAE